MARDPSDYMKPENDPLYQMGQEGQRANAARAQQIAQGWANKEQYYQRQVADAALRIPLKLGAWLFQFVRCVFCVYVAAWIGMSLARTLFAVALWIQGDKGFFNLGLALGLIDAIVFVLAAASAIGAVVALAWGFWSMTWVGKILALFALYNLGLWGIHHWDADMGWKFAGAWFFCIVLSTIIEGLNLWYQNRKSGAVAI
jgi:hypothetical protein